jgi:hypothetical protein
VGVHRVHYLPELGVDLAAVVPLDADIGPVRHTTAIIIAINKVVNTAVTTSIITVIATTINTAIKSKNKSSTCRNQHSDQLISSQRSTQPLEKTEP